MTYPTPPAAPKLQERFAAAGGKPTYVRTMFGRIAGVYDLMNRIMTLGMDERWRDFSARQIALGPEQRALDIGTGTGDLAFAVARRSSAEASVVGVDFTPQMLDIARQKAARLGLQDRVTFEVGDGEGLPFADGTYDACSSAFVVRNLADLEGGFREMLRVVKPGGKVVCLEMSHPHNPLFAAGFHLYFDTVVPLLGRIIGKASEAYTYLPTSVTTFPNAQGLKRVMESVGWRDVRYYYRIGGAVAIHVATKPDAADAI